MPAPIINGLITLMTAQLDITVYDGEVPRYTTSGEPINPDSVTDPSSWPVVRLEMKEPGFSREWTTEDPYTDTGTITIQVWGISRLQVETLLDTIEAFWAQAGNWKQVDLGGPDTNPYYIIQMLLSSWYSGQEEGVRTSKSELLYRGDLMYEVMIHGAVSTL
jgi:hypothetical protein